MRTLLVVAVLAGAGLGLPAHGAAQSALVLGPESGADGDELERARSGAVESLAERGVRLVRAPDGPLCEEPACAAAMLERTGAELAVLLRIESGPRVHARLVSATGPDREASAAVGDAGFAAAAAAAIDEAFEAGVEHRSGFLMVRTRPPGAVVHIDGDRAGESPLRRMVRAGEHRVRVERAARSLERTVDVRPMEESALELDLEGSSQGDEGASAPASEGRTEPSPINWILAGGLAIAGVVTLVSPLQTLATEGQCIDLVENVGCVERVQFGAQSGVLLGVGVLALAAAVVMDVVAPIRVAVGASGDGAMLRVEGRF